MFMNKLGYSYQQNLRGQQKLQNNYYREMISIKGIPAVYFRHNSSFNKLVSTSVYGEDTNIKYITSANVVAYMDMHQDNILMNKFGLETQGDANLYIHKEEFYEQFRDLVGDTLSSYVTIPVSTVISGSSGLLSGTYSQDNLNMYVSSNIDSLSSGFISLDCNITPKRTPTKYNDDIYLSKSYTERKIYGSVSGHVTGNVDLSGYGILSGELSGTVYYYEESDNIIGKNWGIAPQVGDFVRIEFEDDNNEEYEITKVYNRNLTPDGINPMLKKYIWKMNVTRRDPSYEQVTIDTQKEEKFTVDKIVESTQFELKSDAIFDYIQSVDSVDGAKSDAVYGNYTGPYTSQLVAPTQITIPSGVIM